MNQIKNKLKSGFWQKLDTLRVGALSLREFMIRVGYLLILIIIIPLLFPSGRSFKYTDLTVGSVVNKKVIAPFTFSVLKTEAELNDERQKAREQVSFYFEKVDSIPARRFAELDSLFQDLRVFSAGKNYAAIRAGSNSTRTDSLVRGFLGQIYTRYGLSLTRDELLHLVSINAGQSDKSRQIFRSLESLRRLPYINYPLTTFKNKKIVVITDGVEEDQPFETLFDASRLEKRIVATYQNEEKALLYQKLAHTFIEPYVLYRGDITELRQRQAVAAVPLAKDLVYENERIIDANERVTEAIYQKLYSLEVATADRSTEEGDWSNVMSIVGKYVMTILIFFIFTVFLANNRPRVYGNQKMFLLVLVLIFLPVGIGAFFIGVLDWPFYLIPTTISSMLFSMLFDTGIGFVATAVVGILLGGITGLDYTITLFTLVTGIIAVYSVAKIRTRNQIIRAIFFIIVGYFLVEFTFGTLRYEGFNEIFKNFVYYILPNAILSPIITYMMLGLFERVFDITTDVTLLELSDLNHPLLKDLSLKASGTFHHSIVVGSLAEAAAEAIGANSLLARVGSYYHDIGKMQKSEYFIENQKGSENRHQSLAPNMSAMILSAHVRNGMEMAEEHGLPRVIINFIPEHHGTNIMTYFYNKAMESGEDPNLNDTDFRYPGPIPQSKETAIVMLADTAEAATRTLKNPTSGRLRKRVEELAEQRFLEGQLDDCDLTMRDLKRIQEAFVAILEGIYHDRVEYPKKEEPKKTTAENKAHAKKPAGNEEKNGDTGSQPEPGQ